jgi:hypothetical protein
MQNLLAPDEDHNRPTREQYYPILASALARLDDNTAVARRVVYERARAMISEQVRGMSPPLPPPLIARHRLALELAIQQHEIEAMGRVPTPVARRLETSAAPVSAPPRPTPRARHIGLPQHASALGSRQERALASLRNMVDSPPEPTHGLPQSRIAPDRTKPAHHGGLAPDQESPSILHAAPGASERASQIWFGRFLRRASLLTSVVAGLVVIGNWQSDRISSWFDGLVHGEDALIGRLARSQFDLVDAANAVPGEAARAFEAANEPAPGFALGVHAAADSGAAPAVLFQDGPDLAGTAPLSGSVAWRTETIVSPLWRGPERAVRADIDIPGKGTVTVLVRRNFDQGFPASHAIVITASFGTEGVGIKEIPGVLLKRSGEPRGSPLRGVPMAAEGGQFQILLSAAGLDIERNEQMLRERPVLGIPIIYNDGRRSMLTIEKGEQGDRAFDEAFAQWGRATPIEAPKSLLSVPNNLPPSVSPPPQSAPGARRAPRKATAGATLIASLTLGLGSQPK